MTHDPFQTYMHYGVPSPLGLQYPSQQPSAINPIVAALNAILALSPVAQGAGIPQAGPSPYGMNPTQSFINPQQLQQVSLLALQNPLLASVLSNPLIASALHSQAPGPYGAPQFGLQSPSPYPQPGQMGFPLAPQSWIGQGGLFGGAQGFGPLQQLIPRPFQAQGPSPWGY